MRTLWEQHYAQRTQRIKSSAIRELLKLAEQHDVISFAGGLPATDAIPTDQLEDAMHRVVAQQNGAAFQYSSTEGYFPLRDMIARHTSRYGLNITPENILITSGSQQGLDLIGIPRDFHVVAGSFEQAHREFLIHCVVFHQKQPGLLGSRSSRLLHGTRFQNAVRVKTPASAAG